MYEKHKKVQRKHGEEQQTTPTSFRKSQTNRQNFSMQFRKIFPINNCSLLTIIFNISYNKNSQRYSHVFFLGNRERLKSVPVILYEFFCDVFMYVHKKRRRTQNNNVNMSGTGCGSRKLRARGQFSRSCVNWWTFQLKQKPFCPTE